MGLSSYNIKLLWCIIDLILIGVRVCDDARRARCIDE